MKLASRLRAEGLAVFQRRVLVLAGSHAWGQQAAHAVLASAEHALWLGQPEHAPAGTQAMASSRAREVLGEEFDLVCLDVHQGFDPEALGAVAGTVRAGGLLLMLTPPLEVWPQWADPGRARIAVAPFGPEAVTGRLVARLARLMTDHGGVAVATPAGVVALGAAPAEAPSQPRPLSTDGPWRTQDQAEAVAALLKVRAGRARRPVVLTADRGRGKSAALGIAAGQLLAQGPISIVITAPSPRAVRATFALARATLGLPAHGGAAHRLEAPLGGRLIFLAPGELLAHAIKPDLVLVDEAATLPVPVLEHLLDTHKRIAFATTVHGYEGTGRGFTLRFRAYLDAHTPSWRAVHLQTPIRWAAGDPLEAFTFRALCLHASAAPDAAVVGAIPEACVVQRVDRDALAADESTLTGLFGLLITAHYRTTPTDLYRLLDAPNMAVWLARWQGQVVGAALVAQEGGFSPALGAAIYEGRRRPPGHLLPETLAAQSGLVAAPGLRGARVVRIAVHPAVQARGLGGRLLTAIGLAARADGLDYVGSSFGATQRLLRFWLGHGLVPARMGVIRGKSSGAFSAVVLQPLSAEGAALTVAAQARLADELPHALGDGLRTLQPALALQLLRAAPQVHAPVAEADWVHAAACAFGARNHDVVVAPVWRVVRQILTGEAVSLPPAVGSLLLRRSLQRRPWIELGLAGRGAAQRAFRAALLEALQAVFGAPLPAHLARFRREPGSLRRPPPPR